MLFVLLIILILGVLGINVGLHDIEETLKRIEAKLR